MQKECMITLALKIVDDSCKMDDYERGVFMQVYDAMPDYHSDFFESDIFELIEETRHVPTAMLFAKIKPFRQAGMEHVGRPGMKSFKAYVRKKLKE
jgi:hypothetical protein